MSSALLEREISSPERVEFDLSARYVLAEEVPLLAFSRSAVRQEAREIINWRADRMASRDYENIPLSVDALTTAEKVITVADEFGRHSHEYREAYEGLFLDCHRLLAEWRRKNRPEYFPATRHNYDQETEQYYSHGFSIWEMTGAALTPSSKPEETERRVNERVEEATAIAIRKFGNLALNQTVKMRTISECTDWAIDSLKRGEKNGYGGYVPEIEKVMVRDMIFDAESGDRFEEQIGLPGRYITHDVIQRTLKRRGANIEGLDKTMLHGSQLLVSDDLIDFVRLLDQVASEEWCVNVFMGERVADYDAKDYGTVRQDAIRRQNELKEYAHQIAGFVMDLQVQGTDRRKAPAIVEKYVKNILLDMADNNNSLASEMFDQNTARGLREVAYLRDIGREQAALNRLEQVAELAPGGGYCGAGSCDLERVTPGSDEEEAVRKLGFDPKNSLIDRGDRKCKNCKEKTVAYDTSKGMKGCTSCGAKAKYKS